MINSQAIIKNIGEFSNGKRINVQIEILYPNSLPNGIRQNETDNRLSIGDIISDNSGNIWKVEELNFINNIYNCTLIELSSLVVSNNMIPNDINDKNLTSTPNSKGLLAPYYHDSYVSTNSFRAAMSYNMKVYGIQEPGLIMFFEFKNNLNCSISNNILEQSRDNVTYSLNNGLIVSNNNGVNLNGFNSKWSNPNIYTIEIKFKLYDISGYKKIIDYNYYVFDTGLYLYNGNICFWNYDCLQQSEKTNVQPNIFYTIKFIKNLNELVCFIDGIRQFTLPDNNFITDSKSRLGFFTDDTQVSGEMFSGEISYIKIYDGIKR